MILEPCIANKLPEALRKGDRYFSTNGDVLIPKFMDAVASMCDGKLAVILVCEKVDIPLLRHLAMYFWRNWCHTLFLLTKDNQTMLVQNELGGWLDRTQYNYNENLDAEQLTMIGKTKSVILTGPMLIEASKKNSVYSAYFGGDKEPVALANEQILARLRMRRTALQCCNRESLAVLNGEYLTTKE